MTPWTAARHTSLSFTISWSLLKLMSIESVIPSHRLILCHPHLLLASVFPSIRVFSNESALRIRWPKYWKFLDLNFFLEYIQKQHDFPGGSVIKNPPSKKKKKKRENPPSNAGNMGSTSGQGVKIPHATLGYPDCRLKLLIPPALESMGECTTRKIPCATTKT